MKITNRSSLTLSIPGSQTRRLAAYLVEQLSYIPVYNVRKGIPQWVREGNTATRAQL